MASESRDEDRLLVKDGWRHYRRHYSLTGVRWGLATGGVLLAIAGWVVWRGAHPDPALYSDGSNLLAKAGPAIQVQVGGPELSPTAGRAAVTEAVAALPGITGVGADRGPLPAGLAGAGWKEEKVAQYDPDNLYIKINGRADFFKAFGFKRLYSVLLVDDKDAATTVDVEMYDMGTAANALGAYGGERPPTARPEAIAGGMRHFDRNALYLARGPHYIRVIGSDETAAITEKLQTLAKALEGGVEGEALPWSYALFGQMGMDAGNVAYFAENAFSLSYARDVWTVRPAGKDSDLELFVTVQNDPAAASKLAEKLRKSFLELGRSAGQVAGITAVKDQFLGLFSGVTPVARWVVGVRGAASKQALGDELGKLKDALAKAPAEVKDRARPAAGHEAVTDTAAQEGDRAEKGVSGEH